MILGGALNLRGLTGREAQNALNNKNFAARTAATSAAAAAKASALAGKKTFGTPYVRNGRSFRDVMVGGSAVGVEDLGTKTTTYKPDVLQGPDGNLHRISGPIPPGFKKPEDAGVSAVRDLAAQGAQLNLDRTLTGYESVLQSGEAGGRPVSDEDMKLYADLFNKNSTDFEYVQVPDPAFWHSDEKRAADLEAGINQKWTKVPRPVTSEVENAAVKNLTQSQLPTINTQAEYDKLEPGTQFIEDGKTYTKP